MMVAYTEWQRTRPRGRERRRSRWGISLRQGRERSWWLGSIIRELQAALHKHNERLRQLAAQKLGPGRLNQRSR